MSTLSLTKSRIRQGRWEGLLTGHFEPDAPELKVYWKDKELSHPDVEKDETSDDCWRVTVTIPTETLSEGVQSFRIEDARTGARLNEFAIIAGGLASEQVASEVALLRAELDMLKKVVRRMHAQSE